MTVREAERELARLRDASTEPGQPPRLRTSVLTHLAWVPERWVEAATETLAGLAERHPSRTILLLPRPGDDRDTVDAEVDYRCFVRGGHAREVCSEVITLRLCGQRATVPASVVMPLLVSDLPVFLRWRGLLPYGSPELEQLTALANRLVVDSREWSELEGAFRGLPEIFEVVTVSDIAWARTGRWREAVAGLWPAAAEASVLRVAGPEADAMLLAGWLRGRLRRDVRLEREPAGEIELVEVDGREARPARIEPKTSSDLLSDQLDIFARDPIYDEAVRTFSSPTT
jgi:glucose-6-phosphate dehydrogenase assembly protein OpcA